MLSRARRSILIALGLAALSANAGAAQAAADIVPNPNPDVIAVWEPCEPDTGVTVMVSFDRLGDHKLHVRCALGNQPSGIAALQNAGFQLTGTGPYGLGFICRINGFPTPAEETCELTPGGDRYWVYLKGRPGGRFFYSGIGAATVGNEPKINTVEGWAFQTMPVYPMDGRGLVEFELPPEQLGSGPMLRSAQRWLTERLDAHVATVHDSGTFGEVLDAVVGMQRAGRHLTVASVPELFAGADAYFRGPGNTINPERLANLMLAVHATGGDVTHYGALDLRAALLSTIRASGSLDTPIGVQALPDVGAVMLEALARTGPLTHPRLSALMQMIAANAESGTGSSQLSVEGLLGLIEARAHGLSVPELEEVVAHQVGEYLGRQAPDGGIRQPGDPAAPASRPTVDSTAAGALLFAATGHRAEAILAARWLSRYQLTAENVGGGDPSKPVPAVGMVGAFMPTADAMRDTIVNGPYSDGEGVTTTIVALPGIAAAAPYGPLEVAVDPDSVSFAGVPVGTTSTRTVTIVNHDERPVTVTGIEFADDAAAVFSTDPAPCTTITPGSSCQLPVSFHPLVTGQYQATLRATIADVADALEVALTGTGESPRYGPLVEVTPGEPGGSFDPPRPIALGTPGAGSATAVRNAGRLGHGRTAPLTRIACPSGGGTCSVMMQRRPPIRIAGRRYVATVLGPSQLPPGTATTLTIRLPRAAAQRLRGRTARLALTIRLGANGKRVSRRIVVTLRSSGSSR